MLSKGKILRLLRESIGLTQQDVADKVNVTTTYLSLIENDKKTPSGDLMARLSRLYKVPPYLFVWDEVKLQQTANEAERRLLRKIDDFVEELFERIAMRNETRKS